MASVTASHPSLSLPKIYVPTPHSSPTDLHRN
ncbi:rCG57840 [Rattus norvegicus]|uniref:RCG57840 n=1 Tax=Rattus norvegicus TaxID=10116 RepID=A6J543_RAT|nr:rCG57840 [Rattus norvegicus]